MESGPFRVLDYLKMDCQCVLVHRKEPIRRVMIPIPHQTPHWPQPSAPGMDRSLYIDDKPSHDPKNVHSTQIQTTRVIRL
jgi:hypothetical protein